MDNKAPISNPAEPRHIDDVKPTQSAVPAVPETPAVKQAEDFSIHEPAVEPTDEKKDTKAPVTAVHKKPPAAKEKGSGVGGAIFAAVIIVLGLAALFTYAYLRSQNIAVF